MDTLKNTAPTDSETLGLKTIIVGYVRKWRVFAVAAFISLILAVLYLVLVPSTYEVMARIQLQEDEGTSASFGLGEAAGLMRSFGLGGGGGGSVSIDDERVILASNELLREVIKKLDMQVAYMKPNAILYNMYKDVPLSLTFNEETSANIPNKMTFKAAIDEAGRAKVSVKIREGKNYSFEYDALPAVIRLPQGDFTLDYNKEYPEKVTSYKMKMIVKPLSWIAEELETQLLIEDVSKSSNIIEIGFQDYEKQRGTDLLNTLVSVYNKQYEEVKLHKSNKSMLFVEERINNMLKDLYDTEQALEEFKLKNKVTDPEHDLQFNVAQMQELQTKIIDAETQSYIIDLMDDFVKDPANKYSVVPMLLSTQAGETGGGSISLYNQKLMERTQLLKSSRGESPLVLLVNEQADQLHEGVVQSVANAKGAFRQTLADLKDKEKRLFGKMGQVPTLEKEYVNFKRQQEINQGVYLLLLQKKEEIAMTIGEMQEHARIVDKAFIKQKRVAPRTLYAGLGMIVFTLLIPVIWLFCKEQTLALLEEYRKSA